MQGKNKNLIIAGVIVLVVAVAGYLYASRDRSDDILLTSTDAGIAPGAVDDTFLSSLRTLRKLKLDDSIFTTAAWSSLVDFGKVLAEMPAGRTNPFSPIESGAAVAPAATTTSR